MEGNATIVTWKFVKASVEYIPSMAYCEWFSTSPSKFLTVKGPVLTIRTTYLNNKYVTLYLYLHKFHKVVTKKDYFLKQH
jgi:hypothetical protein